MNVVCKMVHGSHLYGLATPESDLDYIGVFMPSWEDLVTGQASHEIRNSTSGNGEKNTSDDVDTVWYSLQKFLKMAADGETIAIDALHVNEENLLETSEVWEEIVSNRDKFYTNKMKAFLGYCRKQAERYSLKGVKLDAMDDVIALLDKKDGSDRLKEHEACLELIVGQYPECSRILHGFMKGGRHIDKEVFELCGAKYDLSCTVRHVLGEINKARLKFGNRATLAQHNAGWDRKAVSHALRVGYQLKEIYETGNLKFPLRDRDFLMKVKNGTVDFQSEVSPILDSLVSEIEELADRSHYPSKVDREYWNQFVIDKYSKTM